jgi:hypothetical protein
MAYRDGWYIEKRVAIQHLYGTVTVDEAEIARNGMNRFLEEGTPLVHVLVDVAKIDKFPTNIVALKHLIPDIDNDKMGWLIIYGAHNVFIRFLASTLSQIGLPGVRLRMFSTLDESLMFLQSQDASLESLMVVSNSA